MVIEQTNISLFRLSGICLEKAVNKSHYRFAKDAILFTEKGRSGKKFFIQISHKNVCIEFIE